MASSSSQIPSKTTTHEIAPAEDTDSTQIPATPEIKKGNEKPTSSEVSDLSKNKKPYNLVKKWLPLGPKHKNSKLGSTAKNLTENSEPNPDDGNNVVQKEAGNVNPALVTVIDADLTFIKDAKTRITDHEKEVEKASEALKVLKEPDVNAEDLRKLKKIVKTLKQQISTNNKGERKDPDLLKKLQEISSGNDEGNNLIKPKEMPNLFKDSNIERTLQFKDLEARYNELDLRKKLCLLCFSVFPEDVEIKKRVMIHWWIGEGFVPSGENPGDKKPEEWATEYFHELMKKGFIESAHKNPSPKVDVCRMHPFVRLMVNKLAERNKFVEFDDEGNVREDYSKSFLACLLAGKGLTADKNLIVGHGLADDKNLLAGKGSTDDKNLSDDKILENLHAIFNVDESILDFKPELFSKMKNVNVLYLGRWQSAAAHHIEVEDSKTLKAKNVNVLDGLGKMKHLRFLSLQGISRVTELPKSISKLKNLTILDIRACHNLEKIPDEIGRLENLTRLDMSECYLLDEMPKGLASLTKLQVLSGFVVRESDSKRPRCTLDDLKTFSELRKLSIHTGLNDFPLEKDLRALNQLSVLKKLTIAWGRRSSKTKGEETERKPTKGEGIGKKNNDGGDLAEARSPEKENEDGIKREDIDVLKQAKEEKFQGAGTPIVESRNDDKNEELPEVKEETKTPPLTLGVGGNPAKASTSKQVGWKLEGEKTGGGKIGEIFEEQRAKSPEQKSDSVPQAAPTRSSNTKGPSKKNEASITRGPSLRRLLSTQSFKTKQTEVPPDLPSQLIKLDLQCFPGIQSSWLNSGKLKKLEKLYIRGGKFFDLGQFEDLRGKWNVKELRLKYLNELDMEWRELLELFPNLNYLEKVNCPKLSFFPCDETGVWMKNPI